MTPKFQRLLIFFFSIALLIGAAILILNNFKSNIVFFYTPSELIETENKINNKIRVGGFVKENSVKKILKPKDYFIFIITDNQNDIIVEYNGILPDMFREKQGVVVEGILMKKYTINAQRVFAKHDENYIPVSIKKQLKKANYWKKDY